MFPMRFRGSRCPSGLRRQRASMGMECSSPDPKAFELEIVTWPSSGWRPIDPGTGDEGGTISGTFEFWWEGEVLRGRNHAVEDEYVLGWATNPGVASTTSAPSRKQVLLWHANYHPDGGQLFFPLDGSPFVAPLALPGDDVKPDDFVAFYIGRRPRPLHPPERVA